MGEWWEGKGVKLRWREAQAGKQLLNQCRAKFTSKIRELSKMYVYTLSCYNEYYGIQCISDMQSYTSQVYWVVTYWERVFPNRAASHPDNVGRVKRLEHGGSLARVDQKQQLIVPDINLVDKEEGSDPEQPCQELMSTANFA